MDLSGRHGMVKTDTAMPKEGGATEPRGQTKWGNMAHGLLQVVKRIRLRTDMCTCVCVCEDMYVCIVGNLRFPSTFAKQCKAVDLLLYDSASRALLQPLAQG